MMMLPNSSAVWRRPLVWMLYVNSVPGGAGSAPIWPPGITVFCARMADWTSPTEMFWAAILVVSSQMRMA